MTRATAGRALEAPREALGASNAPRPSPGSTRAPRAPERPADGLTPDCTPQGQAKTPHEPRRLLITGSRNWTDTQRVYDFLARTITDPDWVIVHGACPTGADAIADHWATMTGYPVERHAADWDRRGKAAGPIRNQEMVDAGADVCLAFPLGESRGTRDCMRRARAAGIPVIEVAP